MSLSPEYFLFFCFILMIRKCRFDLIQYLLYPDDNTQCQPFNQLFHHEIQDRNLVETDSCLSKKMEEYTLSYFLQQYCLHVGITHASTGSR